MAAVSRKTIVITGASYGIGEQLALLLASYQVHLILIARTAEKLETLCETIRSKGSKATCIAADLYRDEEVQRVIDQLTLIPGGIDVFVSNAGKSIQRPFLESLDRYHDVTRTNQLNYLAPVKLILGLMPMLIGYKGKIIHVSAVNVLLLPAPHWAVYQASKVAFDQWFRSCAPEWESVGVRHSRIYLPLVRTRMIAPNPLYRNAPAMDAKQAAKIIASACYTSRRIYKPWWAVFPQLASFFARKPFEYLTTLYVKSKRSIE